MIGTFWSLVPAIVAITLALITKEVYSSLFIGVVIGCAFYAGSTGTSFITHLFNNQTEDGSYGIIAVLSDSWNVGILVFLVLLGTMVCLINKAGGSAAFGRWAKKHIKSKVGAQLATIFLGILIFVDDYFNCLTVGSVMKPITDKHNISREKLAYLIDSTAAPICIIAPISSWAAAVSGFVEGENGLSLFIRAIPYNFYALFTIVMMIALTLMKFDYGTMAKFENATTIVEETAEKESHSEKGIVLDLVFPIIVLIISCVIGMIYTGGFFAKGDAHTNFIDSFANSDASVGLAIGSLVSLFISIVYFLFRQVLTFKQCMEAIPAGFKAMVPAILILTLAWSLKSMTDSLGAAGYVAGIVEGNAEGLMNFMPAIIFVIASLLSFATGTSWGTFGILIPIVVAVFQTTDPVLMIISISACMAGSVCGDHCSPISDTTIMASAGAGCNHVNHVATQLPYSISIAVISFVIYLLAGWIRNAVICLLVGAIVVVGFLFVMKYLVKKAK